MTNVQFLAALSVPFLMFLISTVSNRAAISHLGKRIDDMGKRLDDMNAALNRRIDDLRTDLTGRMDRLVAKLDSIDTEIRIHHDTRLAALETRVFDRAS